MKLKALFITTALGAALLGDPGQASAQGISSPMHPLNPINPISPLNPNNQESAAEREARRARQAAERAALEQKLAEISAVLRPAIADPENGPDEIKAILQGYSFSNFDADDADYIYEAREEILGSRDAPADEAQVDMLINRMHEMDFDAKLETAMKAGAGVAGAGVLIGAGLWLRRRRENEFSHS